MTRRILAAACAAAVIAVIAPAVAGAATRNAFAGGDEVIRNAPTAFSPNAFLRRTMTVHVGDTVRWRFRGFHTVTFPVKGKQPPAFAAPGQGTVSGQLDGAGQPFWFNGQLPPLNPNPAAVAPVAGRAYDGTKPRSSGLPATPPKAYSLRFTRTGTFAYYCTVHPGMKGTVRVVSRRTRVPSEAQNRAAATTELAAIARQARRAAAKPTSATTIELGRAPRGQRFTINAFFPNNPTVKVGQAVTFTMAGQNATEIHTATLGPLTRDQVPFLGQTGINPIAAYPSDPPTAFPAYTGANHGNGFLNTGLLDNDSATTTIRNTAAVTFAAPGTFQLKCLVHPGMDATVTVTP